jgi:hypothetical protein
MRAVQRGVGARIQIWISNLNSRDLFAWKWLRAPDLKQMIKVFGAPLSEADAKAITAYLATTYGPPK